ncbi:DUF2165 family protein [Microvirga alba]|uniref:DUF2165 domain-containing protein n=1 Tax=Microvirga alba TaxID=2791025 RepID=A0A931BSI5_9HYPH|nr:DUF2165 domain-containing protein [Microvirga alba]MBF9234909.1 DUF2165 domain-containing protein [Microvirga alba]
MKIIRFSKVTMVAAMALFAGLVAFGNMTDYGTNFVFVQHVLAMDTVFPETTIKYRAITSPLFHHLAYGVIIAAEAATAILCTVGAVQMLRETGSSAAVFNRSKVFAIAGLTLGFVVWQVGFMSIGGEWFGMWMSAQWNGVPSAFRFLLTIIAVLIYVVLPDHD